MKLTAYVIDGHEIEIRPAPIERDWMEATGDRFAYRCLPLNIANAHGWEILCPAGFEALWTGEPDKSAISIFPDPGTTPPAISHFGHGVLTFHVPAIFRTDPGYDLMVMGPVNRPKDGIAALTGVIETDWAPYGFTMNWLFTHPGMAARFDRGEPFCHLFPVPRGGLDAIEPELRRLSENPELERQHRAWAASRKSFNRDLQEPGSEAQASKWQKLYYRGLDADGRRTGVSDHRTRLRLRPFRKPARRPLG